MGTGGGVAPYWTVSASAFMISHGFFEIFGRNVHEQLLCEAFGFAMADHSSLTFFSAVSVIYRKSGKSVLQP